jgi:uncharacterized protein YciI
MARSPAKEKPAAEPVKSTISRKKAVADAVARTSARKQPAKEAPSEPSPAIAPAPMPKGRLFAVTRSRSVSWNAEQPLEQQNGWTDHAQFMNGLESSGFVVAGGPLEDTPYTFLAVRAENEAEVRSRLAADPWEATRMLETTRIVGWDLKLGAGKL